MTKTIQVEKELFLRVFKKENSAELFDLVDKNRAYLRKWLPWLDFVKSAEDEEKTIQLWNENFNKKEGFVFGIFLNNKIIGNVGFVRKNDSGAAEIGYWLGEEFQGKGIVTKCCKSLIDFGFKEAMHDEIEIRVATNNKKSKSIPERLGFRYSRRVPNGEKLYGRYVDLDYYSITRKDWCK
eukprot:snap_masked-scaffold_4-processed-gene-7.28-mRNA-1 protein AED:1.00 eAED:1.00 QI:0/-1/0/0/-1/1/1/0/180